MNASRRDFLKSASVAALAAKISSASEPTLGMIVPPAPGEIPPEAHRMYPTGVRFLVDGLGLPSMTPAGYDSVIDKIVPSALKLQKQGATAISIMGTSLTFYKGSAFNLKLQDSVKKATGLPVTSMSNGILEGLKVAGARRAPGLQSSLRSLRAKVRGSRHRPDAGAAPRRNPPLLFR